MIMRTYFIPSNIITIYIPDTYRVWLHLVAMIKIFISLHRRAATGLVDIFSPDDS